VRLNESLFYDLRAGATIRCRCGHELGPVGTHYKHLAAMAVFPVQRIGPEVNPHRWNGDRFELREFYCPGCATLLELEIARPGDPLLEDVELDLEHAQAEGP
jgi:acetone carboxylase gamma subunit